MEIILGAFLIFIALIFLGSDIKDAAKIIAREMSNK
jgi:hypothetical protein